jgi:hypothetical protein
MSKSETTPGIASKRREARPMKISDIVVGTRHRRDMGDIDGLAASIKGCGGMVWWPWWRRRGPWRRSPRPTWAYLSERVVWLTSR